MASIFASADDAIAEARTFFQQLQQPPALTPTLGLAGAVRHGAKLLDHGPRTP
jgi:hypothetical protein